MVLKKGPLTKGLAQPQQTIVDIESSFGRDHGWRTLDKDCEATSDGKFLSGLYFKFIQTLRYSIR